MRSSESANRPMMATSVRIRCRPRSRKIDASAASQKTYSYGRQRARRARYWETSDARGCMRVSTSLAAGEQTLRPPDQDDDHDRIDHEGAELGRVILAGHIGDAEQQRGQEWAGDARCAADRDHD